MAESSEQVFRPRRDSLPLSPRQEGHFNNVLRHRRTIDLDCCTSNLVTAPVSLDNRVTISSDDLLMVESGSVEQSEPSISCSTSCSSDDSDLSDQRALVEARSLFGFPYPLLFCLMICFVLLPMQVVWSNGEDTLDASHSNLARPAQEHRNLAANTTTPPPTAVPDAIVFIAIGPAAKSPVLGWSVHSAVRVGGWDGPIFIVTDQPDKVEVTLKPADTTPAAHALRHENLHVIPHKVDMPPSLVSYNSKRTKCLLLDILPEEIQNFVYFDSDIVIGKPLAPFWEEVAEVWAPSDDESLADDFALLDDDISLHDFKAAAKEDFPDVSLGLFQDSGAFTAGFCKGCDTWNTGVMSISRGQSDSCMKAWCETLHVQGGTDQAALDQVIAAGSDCQNIHKMDRKHVRMMKDVFVVWGMIGTKTFNHFTGIFRPKKLSRLHFNFYEGMLGKDLSYDIERSPQ